MKANSNSKRLTTTVLLLLLIVSCVNISAFADGKEYVIRAKNGQELVLAEEKASAKRSLSKDSILNITSEFKGFNKARNVIKGTKYIQNSAKLTIIPKLAWYNEQSKEYYSQEIMFNLDYPSKNAVILGSVDLAGYKVVNTRATSNCQVVFRIKSKTAFVGKKVHVKLHVIGEQVSPPKSPKTAYNPLKSQEILAVIKSYNNAREHGRKFAYGNNFTYYSSDKVNDKEGSALFECDTFVNMVTGGVRYEDSPYADKSPNLELDFQNFKYNSNNYSWAIDYKYDNAYGRRMTNTSSMLWYYWQNEMVFTDKNQLRTGDIVIFRAPGRTTFDMVGHVAMVEMVEENGEQVPYIYHVSVKDYTHGNVLDRVTLASVFDRGRYHEENAYFARLNY